jgi:hypothetical protein
LSFEEKLGELLEGRFELAHGAFRRAVAICAPPTSRRR